MAEKPSFNMSKVSPADKLILGGAGVYFIWSFFKVWYGYNGPGSEFLGRLGVSGKINGWHGPTSFAVILAIIALVWARRHRPRGPEASPPESGTPQEGSEGPADPAGPSLRPASLHLSGARRVATLPSRRRP